MKFWDREKEKEELKAYLKSEPNAILFVYGPKSSGKSTLMPYVIDELISDESFKQSHQVYWFDLRGKLVSSYRDVVDLFFIDEESYRKLQEKSKKVESGFFKFFKVELSTKELIENKRLDPFVYMEEMLKGQEKIGVIVFDELQKLKDVYMNGNGDGQKSQRQLVKELFNFFVRLTKVLHLSHVIVMSSDTFFIEEVYSDSTLKNTSEFYLVDFFDDDTAIKILTDEGLDEEIAKEVIAKIGGVPWMMERVLSNGDPLKKVEDLYKQSKARLTDFLSMAYKNGIYDKIVKGLEKAIKESLDIVKDRELIELLVGDEVLFYDPINSVVKFQTKLDELAAKEILKGQRR